MFFLLFFLTPLSLASDDTVTVSGTVICQSQTAGNVVIRLWDEDLADSDDLLSQMKTTRSGNFRLVGKESNMKPYIQIEHMCGMEKAGCWREIRLPVPQEFVNSQDAYDMTYLALDIHWPEEKEHCP